MNKTPTAIEHIQNLLYTTRDEEEDVHDTLINVENAMIEFAKIHVEAALKSASEKSNLQHQYGYGYYDDQSTKEFVIENKYEKNTHGHGDCGYDIISVNKDSIINAYPLDQIK